MTKNKFISSAYATYSDVLNIINTVVDNDFISVTEFSQLLNIILDTNNVTPHSINKLLVNNHFLIKNSNFDIDDKQLITCKYFPTELAISSCKKIDYNDICFYIWDFNILFSMFKIDFQETLTENSAKSLCNIVKKYVHTTFNISNVFINLIKLQTILNKEHSNF